MLEFREVSVFSPDAQRLIGELNEALIPMIGNNGSVHVHAEEFMAERGTFVVGYDGTAPVCCAGIRRAGETVCELKRVYARRNQKGYGRELMAELERLAAGLGYDTVLLECRDRNPHAIEFYKKNGYAACRQYPPYIGVPDAVCMSKSLK